LTAVPDDLRRVPDDLRRRLPDEVVDELLTGAKTEEEIVGTGGLLAELTKQEVTGSNPVGSTQKAPAKGDFLYASAVSPYRRCEPRWKRYGRLRNAPGAGSAPD
jgi:hypothetical protein